MTFDFDLLVIGAGSGGVRASRLAAQTGAKVAVIDGAALGGTCVNVGCVPKKLYSYASHYAHALDEMRGYGFEINPQEVVFNWEHLKSQRAKEIQRLNEVYLKLLKNAGVTLIEGWASIVDQHTVAVQSQGETKTYTAQRILIAVGSTPFVPKVEGQEHVVTSNEIFDLPTFPKRMVIVGGGYIASEFACIFNALGSKIYQVHLVDELLFGFDEDISRFITEEIKKSGVEIFGQSGVTHIQKMDGKYQVTLKDGTVLSDIDTVFYATGRTPNLDGLGLENAGVQLTERGAVQVNELYQTNVDSIYAIGDVTGHIQLTPVATAQAGVLVDNLFGEGKKNLSYDLIPTAVFTHPNVGTVGLSEHKAREQGYDIEIYRSEFRAMKHTLSGASTRTLMKLVVDKSSRRVLGLHMVGEEAGEIVQGFAVAMKAGATKEDFDATIGIHPTAAEEFVTMRVPVKE